MPERFPTNVERVPERFANMPERFAKQLERFANTSQIGFVLVFKHTLGRLFMLVSVFDVHQHILDIRCLIFRGPNTR